MTKEEKKVYDRTRYEANKEKIKQRVKEWQAANPEKVTSYKKKWEVENTDYRAAYAAQRYVEKRDYILAQNRAWAKANLELCRLKQHRRRLRHLEGYSFMSKQDRLDTLAKLVMISSDPCFYCGETKEEMTDDHWIPLAKGGTNHWYNFVRACKSCNSSKGAKTGEDYMALKGESGAKQN